MRTAASSIKSANATPIRFREDYDRLDHVVERALDELGGDAAELRRLLASRYPAPASMPPAEAALFAVRKLSPRIGDELMDGARHHDRAA